MQQSTHNRPPHSLTWTPQLTACDIHIAKYYRHSFSSYQSLAYRRYVQAITLARHTGCYKHCHSSRPTNHIRRRFQIFLLQWHTILHQRWIIHLSTEESFTDWDTGVAYQLTDQDPLLDTEQCTLDASLMADLGANTIRVYHVDPTADHDGCMSAFANVGIYLFVDLDTFDTQFNQASRWLSIHSSIIAKLGINLVSTILEPDPTFRFRGRPRHVPWLQQSGWCFCCK